jgi:hypothetical protein
MPPKEEAQDACLLGANVEPFWVLRKTSKGFDLVLSQSAHDLKILSTRSNGYRDIRLFSLTATTVITKDFKFDGKAYRFHSSKSAPIA